MLLFIEAFAWSLNFCIVKSKHCFRELALTSITEPVTSSQRSAKRRCNGSATVSRMRYACSGLSTWIAIQSMLCFK
eukprot:1551143-Amphidinium_carterae.3